MKGFSKPAVLLFGAGSTRGSLNGLPQPPPVDADFFDIAARLKSRGTGVLAKKVLKDVFSLYRRTSGVSLEEYYRDIEARGKIRVFTTQGHRHKDWETRKKELTELMRRVFIYTTTNMKDSPPTPRADDMHDRIFSLAQSEDTVITSNYDLVLEESLLKTGLWNPIRGYGTEVSKGKSEWLRDRIREARDRKKPLPAADSVTLLKLHGSINWKPYGGNKIRIKQRPYFVSTSAANTNEPRYDNTEILGPGWFKNVLSRPYVSVWASAGRALQGCGSLVIVGYALPETDLLAKALFSEVIRIRETSDKWLTELHLADPNEKVRSRFIEMFFPLLRHNGKVFQYTGGIREFADRCKKGWPGGIGSRGVALPEGFSSPDGWRSLGVEAAS